MRAWGLTFAVLWPSVALAQASMTNTLVVDARGDNGNGDPSDDGFGLVVDRLNLQYAIEGAVASLRLDAVGVSGVGAGSPYRTDVRPERVGLRLGAGELELAAGDFPKQLGRGILLSIRKVDEVGLDLSLRGAELAWSPEGHVLSAFVGVLNPSNLDAVSSRPLSDPGDMVAGASYELGALEGATLSANAVYLQPAERLIPEELDYTVSGGLGLELPALVDGLALYAEADLQSRRLAGSAELGHALYLTADAALGPLALLLEGLWLGDFEQRGSKNEALGSRFSLNQPPTLERVDQEISNDRDVVGARLRAELAFDEGALLVYANGVLRVADAGAPTELVALHGYGGVERRFDEQRSKAALSLGVRDESQSGLGSVKTLLHGELELSIALGERQAVHAMGNVELRGAPATRGEERYVRGSSSLGLERGGLGGLTVELGYDTEQPDERHLFLAGILALQLSDEVHLRGLAGTQRGGLKCSNGVCRDFPEFAGGKLELVVRL